MRHTKIEEILNNYKASIIIGDITKIVIDEIEYIEKKSIYKLTNLDIIDIKNILNSTSSLRHILNNSTLRTLRIKNSKYDYIIYSLEDILKLNDYKRVKCTNYNSYNRLLNYNRRCKN